MQNCAKIINCLQLRQLSTSAALKAVQSGRFRVSIKHDNPLTYEEAQKPHQIGVYKDWCSLNTANHTPFGIWKSEIAIQDIFIRKFVTGTFHNIFVSNLLIKRQGNLIRICGIVQRSIHPRKFYFLIGYCEELLGGLVGSVVKLELQSVGDKRDVVFKYV